LIGSTAENPQEASLQSSSPSSRRRRPDRACGQTDQRRKATPIPARFGALKTATTEKPQRHGGEVRSSIALLPSAYTKSETAVL
jgi:hypothetical protein